MSVGPPTRPSDADVWHLMRARWEADPGAVVAVTRDAQVTAGELLSSVLAAADALRRRGIQVEDRVVAMCPRGVPTVQAMCAAWDVGATYVPLDRKLPADRLERILNELTPRVVLTYGPLPSSLDAGTSQIDLGSVETRSTPRTAPVDVHPEAAAYVIYTSGSTGQPKGVTVSRRSLSTYSRVIADAYGVSPADRFLQFASVTFDVSIEEIVTALPIGGSIAVLDDEILDPAVFCARVEELGVTTMSLPSSFFAEVAAFLESRPDAIPESLRVCWVGGERVESAAVGRWLGATKERIPVVNAYGPTETTVTATIAELAPSDISDAPLPIGKTIANTVAYVVDEKLLPVVPGDAGELVIGGEGVARGYWGDPAKTAASFVPDPFSSVPGARLYRTGDRVRVDAQGRFVFLGRFDDQLKVRGFRIEPAEIEAAAARHASVAQAAVAYDSEHQRLILYWVSAGDEGQTLSSDALLDHLRGQLPSYMVPAVAVPVQMLPLTVNGKIDRSALPKPPEPEKHAFADEVQAELAAIWQQVLGAAPTSPDDDFAALGGHSLAAMRLAGHVRRRTGRDLSAVELLKAGTLAKMAALVSATECDQVAAPAPALQSTEPVPLTTAQEELMLAEQLGTNTSISVVGRLDGGVDLELVRRCCVELAARHPALRTEITEAGGKYTQRVLPTVEPDVALVEVRVSEVDQRARELADAPFALDRGVTFRVRVLQDGAAQWLLMTISHLVSEERSIEICLRDLLELCAAAKAGRKPELPKIAAPSVDANQPANDSQVAEFAAALGALPTPLDLLALSPTIASAPEVHSVSFQLGEALRRKVDRATQGTDATPFSVCMAAWAATLVQLTGQDEIAFGVPVSTRSGAHDDLVGLYVNTLPIRVIAGRRVPPSEYVRQTTRWQRLLLTHARVTTRELAGALGATAEAGAAALYNTLFVYNAPYSVDVLPQTELGLSELRGVHSRRAILPLEFAIWPTLDGFAGTLDFNPELIDQAHACRLVEYFERALEELTRAAGVREPWPSIAAGDLEFQLQRAGDPSSLPSADPVHIRFDEYARSKPELVAVVEGERRISYGELRQRALAGVYELRRRGARLGDVVAVAAGHSIEAIVACTAAFYGGFVYLPIDLKTPADRLRAIVELAGARFVVTTDHHEAPQFPDGIEHVPAESFGQTPTATAPIRPPSNAPAYLMFTSGSTGSPKGVAVPHGALAAETRAAESVYRVEPGVVIQQFTSMVFDVSMEEFWVTLGAGGTLVMREEAMLDPTVFFERCERNGTHVASLPTSFFAEIAAFVSTGARRIPQSLRLVVVGGERLAVAHVRRWLDAVGNRAPVVNVYGPTETTCAATTWHASTETFEPEWKELPIGLSIACTTAYVVDAELELVPTGVVGELLIGGDAVSLGYVRRPADTAKGFVPDPYSKRPGARAYRTGDLVRWRMDGQLEFVGRRDRQVKIRALRIELGEIEGVILGHPDARQAVVVVRQDSGAGPRLVAYASPRSGRELDEGILRELAAKKLPAYMVPSAVVVVPEFPLTPNGKIDERRLPEPPAMARDDGLPLETETERRLAALWTELLEVEPVWRDDDFFALGGHSLMVVRLVSRLRDVFGVDLTMMQVHRVPGLQSMAALIDEALAAGERLAPIPKVGKQNAYPVGLYQLPAWGFEERVATNAWTTPIAFRTSDVTIDVLREAFHWVADRHAVCRMRFSGEAFDAQVHLDGPVAVRVRESTSSDEAAETERFVRSCCEATFSPREGGLVRLDILKVGEREHVLVLAAHHLVASDRSIDVLFTDLLAAIDRALGDGAPPPPLEYDYLDFCAMQRAAFEADDAQLALKSARERLAGARGVALPELAVDRLPARGAQREYGIDLSPWLDRIDRFRASTQASRNMVVLAALKRAFAIQADSSDLVFMLVDTTARWARSAFADTVGMFANHYYVRTNVAPDLTPHQLLERVQSSALEARQFALPSAYVLETVDVFGHPLSGALLNARPAGEDARLPKVAHFRVAPVEIPRLDWYAKAPLSMQLIGDDSLLRFEIHAADDLFDASRVQTLLDALVEALGGMVGEK